MALRHEASGDESARIIAANAVGNAEDEVAFLEARVAELTLYAPMAGTIVTSNPRARLGDQLDLGEKVLDVADLKTWELLIEVPEADIVDLERSIAASAEAGGAEGDVPAGFPEQCHAVGPRQFGGPDFTDGTATGRAQRLRGPSRDSFRATRGRRPPRGLRGRQYVMKQ